MDADRDSQDHISAALKQQLAAIYAGLASRIAVAARTRQQCLVVGLSGPQGSGKTTLAHVLNSLLDEQGIRSAVLSLDDLYLPRIERALLAQYIHPLLQTRGVPGTHDVPLGNITLDALGREGIVAIPSFDKSCDDRRPHSQWARITAPVRVVLFEGWCVGARAQSTTALQIPINALERELDPEGIWRQYVNDALAGPYRSLFGRIDLLVLLQPPSFDVVFGWRREQEQKLLQQVRAENGVPNRVMNDEQLRYFIAHYERLTRHILREMPSSADVVIELDAARNVRRRLRVDGWRL